MASSVATDEVIYDDNNTLLLSGEFSMMTTTSSTGESKTSSSGRTRGGGSSVFSTDHPFDKSTSFRLIQPTKRRSNDQTNLLTINKLSFRDLKDRHKLWGRESEMEFLHSKLEDLTTKQQQQDDTVVSPRRQLVWIHGHSGCGKTALAHCLRKSIKKQHKDGVFVSGKFDFSFQQEPYSGFVAALGSICAKILVSEQQHVITDKIRSELGPELVTNLMQVIPPLAELWDGEEDDDAGHNGAAPAPAPNATTSDNNKQQQQQQQSSSSSTEEAKNRFTFSVKTFLSCVVPFFSPMVIVLDDLQWADINSLDLLESLMGDRDSPLFMLVGTYRSNEVPETHPLTKVRRNLDQLAATKKKDGPQQRRLEVNGISVGNLDLPAVHGIIQSLLSLDDDDPTTRTLGLANLCLKKTDGNVFFLLQYMVSLHKMELLKYNLGTLSWYWDESEIAQQTKATENVVDLLQSKMLTLDAAHREILSMISCFGSSFHPKLLDKVWDQRFQLQKEKKEGTAKSIDDSGDDGASPSPSSSLLLDDALFLLETEGYVEHIDGNICWVHDRIQEAAASLNPEESRPAYRRQVGKILLSSLEDDHERKDALFVIVELLNQSTDPDQSNTQLLEEAKLNLQATERAISLSAFDTAATYAGKGISLLESMEGEKNTYWSEHYDLALELYSLGARAECYRGNVETMEKYCDQVLAQTKRPTEDKFRVYDTLADSLANRGKVPDASEVLLEVLEKYGCKFPRPGSISLTGGILYNLIKIKSSLKADWFDKLEEITDPTLVALLSFLNKLITYFYVMDDDRLALVVFRMVNWTLKHGYCVYSAIAIGFTGVILVGALNDLRSADVCRGLAVYLTNKMDLGGSKARVNLILHGFVQHWSLPIADSIKPLQNGYEFGLKSGDAESASWNIHHCCLFRFYTGVALSTLVVDLQAYCAQMEDLERHTPHSHASMVLETILNLQNRPKSGGSCLVLQGENEALADGGMQEFVVSVQRCQYAMLYCYMGAHEQLAELTCEIGYDYGGKVFPGTVYQVTDIYTKGISCFAAARDPHQSSKAKKQKYSKLGKKCLDRLRLWSKNGNKNIHHQLRLVEAEYAAFRGKSEIALGLYTSALRLAGRSGFQQDAGLASERLCEFYVSVVKDLDEARYWLGESMRYYSGWGASAKVEMLLEKYSSLDPTPIREVMAVS